MGESRHTCEWAVVIFELQLIKRQSVDSELPMFAVFESINLGLFDPPKGTVTSNAVTLARASSAPRSPQAHPTFVLDPLRADRVFITHSRGVHRLDMRGWVSNIARVLKSNSQDIAGVLQVGDKQQGLTEVRWLLRTENRQVGFTTTQPLLDNYQDNNRGLGSQRRVPSIRAARTRLCAFIEYIRACCCTRCPSTFSADPKTTGYACACGITSPVDRRSQLCIVRSVACCTTPDIHQPPLITIHSTHSTNLPTS